MKLPDFLQLEGQFCTLESMVSAHFPELFEAGLHPEIWQHLPLGDWNFDSAHDWFKSALDQKRQGTALPFVIRFNKTGQIVGSTRFQHWQPEHRNLEIGWSWLNPASWKTGVNAEAKAMLLEYAFEKLRAIRVGFKTDEYNLRSQQALKRLGAQLEGIHRNHMIRPDGSFRNSFFYSITEADYFLMKLNVHVGQKLNSSMPHVLHYPS